MKTVCVTQAEFGQTLLGSRSRLADKLAEVPVLRRGVLQMMAIKGVENVIVLVKEAHAAVCRDVLHKLDVVIQAVNSQPPPWSRLVCASRKWSLDGWRGGVGGATVFDEFTDCRVLTGVLERFPADAVLSVPAGAPLLNAVLAEQMIEHRREHRDEARLTFTQAVPGVAGILLDASLVRELAGTNIPISWLFSYKPDDPRKDLIFQPACLDIPAPLRFAAGRLIADTDRSTATLATMLARQETWDLHHIGKFLLDQDETGTADFPYEVEIELTTDDPFPDSLLVPRGRHLQRDGSMALELVEKIAAELAERDDSLCVLGGFGDPLRHPEFPSVLEILRPRNGDCHVGRGIFGLCVRTGGADLTFEIQEALITHGVDILNVCVDAWTEETFRGVKGLGASAPSGLRELAAVLDAFGKLQHERQSPVPIMVPEMIKARENVHELDAFFDGWLRKAGAANISGASHFAGLWAEHGVIDMRPPLRVPCRRLRSRCLILCDGRAALCDQDFRGLQTFGNVRDTSLAEIWHSPGFQAVRQQHLARQFDQHALCAACTKWHDP